VLLLLIAMQHESGGCRSVPGAGAPQLPSVLDVNMLSGWRCKCQRDL
jgi:hypothetical protein